MAKFMTALALIASAAPALAQNRPQSVAMTCGQSAALVLRQGAVVLGTGGYTYDRYVSDKRFCQATETTRPAFVATRDNRACFVGYTCYEPSNRDPIGDM